MDAKNGLEAFHAIRRAVDEGAEREAFDSAIKTQYGHAVEQAGPVAVASSAGSMAKPNLSELLRRHSLEASVANYLDSEAELSAVDQLGIMMEFWGRLSGHKLPNLNDEQLASLSAAVREAGPGKRIVVVPLLDFDERRSLAQRAKQLPGNSFTADQDVLIVTDVSREGGQLLRRPERTITSQFGTALGLRYKTPDGNVVSKSGYKAAMIEAGQAVEDNDGIVWLFPVMEVMPSRRHRGENVGDLYMNTDPSITSDALMTIQLLHQVAGVIKLGEQVDFANEAVWTLDEAGNPEKVLWVFGTTWNTSLHSIELDVWDVLASEDSYSVREGTSGLKKP